MLLLAPVPVEDDEDDAADAELSSAGVVVEESAAAASDSAGTVVRLGRVTPPKLAVPPLSPQAQRIAIRASAWRVSIKVTLAETGRDVTRPPLGGLP